MIRLENVCKNFGDLQVLKNDNLEVKEGEKLVIIGPSGSGKSTTVRCMNFLEEPTSGHVYIDGQKLTHANKTKIIRESISMVFQQFNLYPHCDSQIVKILSANSFYLIPLYNSRCKCKIFVILW